MYAKGNRSYFVIESFTMKLMMYIGNDLIEAIQLEDDKIRIPGYVGDFKRFLKTKYQEQIRELKSPPDFLVTEFLPQSHQADNKV